MGPVDVGPGSLPADIEREAGLLSGELGVPLRWRVKLGSDAVWDRRNRRSEVCMVVRRPGGTLLTFRKTFYPVGVFRLLTGGVEVGESVLDALRREVAEETGLQVMLSRFLALLSYLPEGGNASPRAFTFAFLLDEVGGALRCADPNENVAAFSEVRPDELPELAGRLENLPSTHSRHLGEDWRDWGQYRSVVHRAVGQALHVGAG